MELTYRQAEDRDMSSVIWYIFRDYGDIQIAQDDRWAAVVKMADEAGRKYPEGRRLFTDVLGVLEDRAKGKYQKEI